MVSEESVKKARSFSAKLSNAIEGAIDQVTIKGPISSPFNESSRKRDDKPEPEEREPRKRPEKESDDEFLLRERVAILEKRVSKLERWRSEREKGK